MIYMVDHGYNDAATEPAWHAWYAGYLQKLVSVPGIHGAQRFRVRGSAPSRYLAMYSIDSADVYTSQAYKNIGGGGSQSAAFTCVCAVDAQPVRRRGPRADGT